MEKQYPQSCVCYLEFGESGSNNARRGTGWIANASRGIICTSGHNIQRAKFRAGWVSVWVGARYRQDGSRRRALSWTVHPRWAQHRHRASDLAVVKVGDLRAYGGFGFEDKAREDLRITILGFAGKGPKKRRRRTGTISTLQPGLLRYTLDKPTQRGMSGAPVWFKDATGAPFVVGVHSHESGRAVRLTSNHVNWIESF